MLINAEKVRLTRLQRGWTQEQFAELCGLSVRTVQRIEKSGTASLDSANALAAVLETDRIELLQQGGISPARTELLVRHIGLIAGVTFLLGLGIGLFL